MVVDVRKVAFLFLGHPIGFGDMSTSSACKLLLLSFGNLKRSKIHLLHAQFLELKLDMILFSLLS